MNLFARIKKIFDQIRLILCAKIDYFNNFLLKSCIFDYFVVTLCAELRMAIMAVREYDV